MDNPLPADQAALLKQALLAGSKIEAIKIYRTHTGLGLAEAKQAVEQIEAALRITEPGSFTQPKAKGCGVAALALVAFVAVGCAMLRPAAAPGSFDSARAVIERNCVHCHGTQRLAQMPSFSDTGELRKLIGPANWIVPGRPEASRFFHVVTFPDAHPTAMPPTGHAIDAASVEALRAWIKTGAPLPSGAPVPLRARGDAPHSI